VTGIDHADQRIATGAGEGVRIEVDRDRIGAGMERSGGEIAAAEQRIGGIERAVG
jgi:hypothetical protein